MHLDAGEGRLGLRIVSWLGGCCVDIGVQPDAQNLGDCGTGIFEHGSATVVGRIRRRLSCPDPPPSYSLDQALTDSFHRRHRRLAK